MWFKQVSTNPDMIQACFMWASSMIKICSRVFHASFKKPQAFAQLPDPEEVLEVEKNVSTGPKQSFGFPPT